MIGRHCMCIFTIKIVNLENEILMQSIIKVKIWLIPTMIYMKIFHSKTNYDLCLNRILNKKIWTLSFLYLIQTPRNLTSLHISCLNCVWCTRWERQKTDSISKNFLCTQMVGSSESSTWSNKSYQTHNEVKVRKK